MSESKIQKVFSHGFGQYLNSFSPSNVQYKAALSIMNCKTGRCGHNISICGDCGHTDFHSNSCRNRNCPNCQAVLKEVWVDSRRAEVIDAPYFHVVFTVPAELNPLIYANQKLLYSLLHRCSAETLLELANDKKYLGATPGIIQVLHTWGQRLNFHPHIHCIVSGAGLTKDLKVNLCRGKFFLPVKVMASKFRGKFLAGIQDLYASDSLAFPSSCKKLRSPHPWKEFRNDLYRKEWCPYIKETFNGSGNAIEYLGRYTHRIAITNTRIRYVSQTHVTFSAKDYKTGEKCDVTLENREFIRRLLMHVLPHGFQKIRYYGFLCNRAKKRNLRVIFQIQGGQRFHAKFSGMAMGDLLKQVWGYDIHICPACGCYGMRHAGRTFSIRR